MPEIVGRLRPPRLSAPPASPAPGEEYFDTGTNTLYYWNGTAWVSGGSGGGGGGGHTIQDEGVALPARTGLNFTGKGVTVADNGAANRTDVAIPGPPTQATVAARMYRAAAFSATVNAWTKIPLDAVAFDTSGMTQVANGRIVCSVGGYYQIAGGVQVQGFGYLEVAIYKNGSLASSTSSASMTAGAWTGATQADAFQCNAGDYLELWVYTNIAAVSSGITGCYLSASLVSPLGATAGPTTPARMYRSAALTPAAGWNKVALDIITSDPGGNFVTATSRYVCPASGYYQVNAHVEWITATSGQLYGAAAYKNGTSVAMSTTPGAGNELGTGTSDVIQCNAGDYLELYSYSGNGTVGAGTSPNNTYLSVVQVGQLSQLASGLTTGAVAARAHRGAALTPAASTWTKIPLDAVDFDTAGICNVSAGRIQIQTAGFYQVNAAVNQGTSATGTYTYFVGSVRKNGGDIAEFNSYAAVANYAEATWADVIQCNPGDYLELWIYSNQATALNVQTQLTWLSVSMVSALPSSPALASVARAYRAAALTLASGFTKVPLDTISNDPGNNVSTANGRYVCPATGSYQVDATASVNSTASGDFVIAAIYRNGAEVCQGANINATAGSQLLTSVVSDVVQCNAGDYLELYAGQNGKAAAPGSVSNFLSVVQVGQAAQINPPASMGTVAARAYRSGTMVSVPVNTWTKIPVDVASFDPSGIVDTANGRLRAPVAGYYQYNADAIFGPSATAQRFLVAVYKNGSVISQIETTSSAASGQFPSPAVADVVQLNAGDYLELWVFTNAGGSFGGTSSQNYLSMALITPISAAAAPTTVAKAERTGGGNPLTLATNAWTVLATDQTIFDPGNNLGASKDRYICPATGYYQVDGWFGARATASGQRLQAGIFKNGSFASGGSQLQSSANASLSPNVSDIIQCNAGDYLQLAYFSDTAMTLFGGSGNTYLSVVMVGQQSQLQSGLTTGAVAARAYRNAAFTPAAGTWAKIPVDTATFDTNGIVNLGSGRIQIQTAGYYQVNGAVGQISTAANQQLTSAIYKNGSAVEMGNAEISTASGQGIESVVSDLVQCNAGDYLELYAYPTAAIALWQPGAGMQSNFLSASMVSALPSAPAVTSAARAYRNAALTIPNAAWTKVPVDTNSFDPGGNMQITNGRYVCPATGTYQVDAQVGTASGNPSIAIYKNGAFYSQGATGNGPLSVVSDMISCNAGDYLELWTWVSPSVALGVGSGANFLSVVQVGQQAQLTSPGQTSATMAARAYRAGAFTTGAGAYSKITLDTVSYDTSGLFQVANGRMVAPVAGYYQVNGEVAFGAMAISTDTMVHCDLFVNGGASPAVVGTVMPRTDSQGYARCNVADILRLNVGDYVELYCYTPGSYPLYQLGGAYNYLSMTLLTPLSAAAAPATAARVHRSATQSLTGAQYNKITFDTADYDPGANFNAPSSRYVCPASGYYQVNSVISLQTGTTLQVGIYKNGALYSTSDNAPVGAGWPYCAISDLIQCNAGDYIEMYAYPGAAATTLAQTQQTYMSVVQAGQTAQLVPAVTVSQLYAMTAGYTPDRAMNPQATSLGEVANVLATLIDDLKTAGFIKTS